MKASRRKRARKATGTIVFDSIRKPLAPPGHPLARAKPDDKARPAQRKAKHKRRPDAADDE